MENCKHEALCVALSPVHSLRTYTKLQKPWESQTHKFVTLESLSEVSKDISKENNSTYIRGFSLSLQSLFALSMVSEQLNVPYCSYQLRFSARVISLSGEAIIFSFLLSRFSENCDSF